MKEMFLAPPTLLQTIHHVLYWNLLQSIANIVTEHKLTLKRTGTEAHSGLVICERYHSYLAADGSSLPHTETIDMWFTALINISKVTMGGPKIELVFGFVRSMNSMTDLSGP